MEIYARADLSDSVADPTMPIPDWVSCDEDEHAREVHRRLIELGQMAIEARELAVHDRVVRLTATVFIVVFNQVERRWSEEFLRRQLRTVRELGSAAANWPDLLACLERLIEALDAFIEHRDGLHGDGSGDDVRVRPGRLEVLS